MRTLAVINQKGGVGKTTTAVSLAAMFGRWGRRTLLVDLDSQANTTRWLRGSHLELGEDGDRLLADALTEGTELPVHPSAVEGVDLVPSSGMNMASLDLVLSGEPGAQLILRQALHALPDRWDYVLLDCPPSLGLMSVSALAAANDALVPIEPKGMALEGLRTVDRTVGLVGDRLNPELKLSGILVCRANQRTRLTQDVVEAIRAKYPAQLISAYVRENVTLAEANSHRMSIFDYAPSSNGAADYEAVAREVIARAEGAN